MGLYPSDEACDLIRQLAGPGSIWGCLRPGHSPRRCELAARLAALGEQSTILVLAELATDRDPTLAATAASGVTELMRRLPVDALPALDSDLREHWHRWDDPIGLSPRNLLLLFRHGDPAVDCLGVASCHPNGHVREAAVRHLAALGARALPWLLLRVDDWVAEVRSPATTAALALIEAGEPSTVAPSLPLVLRLAGRDRFDASGIPAAVRKLLNQPAAWGHLGGLLSSRHAKVQVLAAELLLAREDKDPADVLDKLTPDSSCRTRLLLARACRRRSNPERLEATCQALASDPFPPVRAELLEAAVERLPARAAAALEAGLLDPSSWVRTTARYHARRQGLTDQDLSDRYRERLARETGRPLSVCLIGLSETGTPADLDQVEPFTRHHLPAVRQAAACALDTFAPEHVAVPFASLLHDPSPAVSRAATIALRRRIPHLPPDSLYRDWETATGHARANLFRLLMAQPRWDRLASALMVVATGTEAEREEALREVKGRIADPNRTSTRPTPAQTERLARAQAAAAPTLDEPWRHELSTLLRDASR